MADRFVSRGFVGKRREAANIAERIPPGQYLERGFPVLSAGPNRVFRSTSGTFGSRGWCASR